MAFGSNAALLSLVLVITTHLAQAVEGDQQSPIHIKRQGAVRNCSLGDLEFDFSLSNGTIISGQDVYEVILGSGKNTVTVDGAEFELLQFHLHHPSEHVINGKRFALEMHLVYQQSNASRLAVVAQLYKKGEEDDFLAQVIGLENDTAVQLDLDELNLGNGYFRYFGSLTTPPFTESVTWTVLTQRKTVSYQQIGRLKQSLGGTNSRPLQALNNRTINIYDLSCS